MRTFVSRWRLRLFCAGLAVTGLVVCAGPAARAWERYQRAHTHQRILRALAQPRADDAAPDFVLSEGWLGDGVEEDDPLLRRIYNEAYWGRPTPDLSEQIVRAAARENGRARFAGVSGPSWIPLGPTDARLQRNGQFYDAVDSGRPVATRVDPRDPNVVYLATSSGGVWKTYNFGASQPTWIPITDALGLLSVGAFDLDPKNPDTLWLGVGDFVDLTAGGAVYKSRDGGGSWTLMSARLAGTYPAAYGGRTESAVAIRDLAIDPNDGNKVLIATDVGLFRTADGGATFTLVPLPDNAGNTLESSTWTLAYAGAAAAQSVFLLSGINACATNMAPPATGGEIAPGGTNCARGTLGDVWRSVDSGATWSSLRAAGSLPPATTFGTSEYGRIALAAGNPKNPDATVLYAQVANAVTPGLDPNNPSKQLAVFKSVDGGKTFTAPLTAFGTAAVSNPTTGTDCVDLNVAHDQAWYNQAIAVDPTDDNHVLVGGNLCGVRSTDGGATWSNVSDWLPSAAATANGTLPYVHADWHSVRLTTVGGAFAALVASDGGIFVSSDVFSAATGEQVTWNHTDNRGIQSHLFYSLATGDPVAGDQDVVWGGLQDNGTRFRDLDPTKGVPTTFNQVIGGDGIGVALVRVPGGGKTLWGSVEFKRLLCTTDPVTTCSQGTGWNPAPKLMLAPGDSDPFLVRYATVDGDANGAMLTTTTFNVFKLSYNGGALKSAQITANTWQAAGKRTRNLVASPFMHASCAGAQPCRLYGVALSGGYFSVGTDVAGTVTWADTVRVGIGAAPNQRMLNTTSIAFPSSAAHFAPGAVDGKVFIVTSAAPRLADNLTVVPDSIGRIFLTTDGGQTFTPFHGNGSSDLPNVPQQVVVFDPGDPTDSTLFVGNDLGVYQSTDMGKTWHRYGVGLPMGRVVEIRIAPNSSLMRVATYGRGLWEIYPNAAANAGVRGDGDWDRNLAIDFLDLGAMASRLGTSPATTAQPFYDWNLDLSGSADNTIGDDDLGPLLTKFGSHP